MSFVSLQWIIRVLCACSAGLLIRQAVFATSVQLGLCFVHSSLAINMTDIEMLHSFKRSALAGA